MPLSKTKERENAFLVLFEYNFNKELPLTELFDLSDNVGIKVDDNVKYTVMKVIEHNDELNNVIEEFSTKRKVNRIAILDKIILKLALYEILYENDIPENVSISEAVKIAGNYGSHEDVSFVNGLLGKFSREYKKEQ